MKQEEIRREWEKTQNSTKKIDYYGFCDLMKCPDKENVRKKIGDGIKYIHWLEEKIVELTK